ncbi:LOW QUALITY PROTEIN: Trehalose-phosphatase [Dillenia turbinata]|uniref:Trehalose-phosphatase n=1 Tax=Dillenia turbinata TaxID=194707 RepID=A0AAN8WAN6_9MAGN
MEQYTETTDGSFIEHKESALVWHHQEADPDFGSCQLLDHLENVLANEPVVVKRGQHIVEVKPQGVSKGVAVETSSKQCRLGEATGLCIVHRDDRSDEDMFESIANSVGNPPSTAIAEVYASTVGQKLSKAKYYLDDTYDVIKLLQGIASASVRVPSRHSFKSHSKVESTSALAPEIVLEQYNNISDISPEVPWAPKDTVKSYPTLKFRLLPSFLDDASYIMRRY